MSNKKRIGMILLIAVLGFSCAPTFSLASAPTLDPFSMSTAIAQTADAASMQTAAAVQPGVQASPVPGGPLLDQDAFNTSIAQTFEAAGTQTAALVPNTLTPTPTLLPTQTAIDTPSPTATFLLTIHTSTPFKLPKPTATKKGHKGGGGGGGGGGGDGGGDDGGGPTPKAYSCSVVGMNPPNNTVVQAGTNFRVFWTVKNTASPWDINSVDLVYKGGDIPVRSFGYDLPFSVYTGFVVTLPGVDLTAPSKAGRYSTHWQLSRGARVVCDLYATIIVGAPTPTKIPTVIVSPPP
ncbi:MAG: hypothetical protein HYZ25_02110 [Chloroflexi bacterium]|nr:hypothetical protein [Chloroflexota bacterium]